MPATSEPASGSEQQYEAKIGSRLCHPRYLAFCSSLPAMMIGSAASAFPAIEVLTPAHAQATLLHDKASS